MVEGIAKWLYGSDGQHWVVPLYRIVCSKVVKLAAII